MKKSHLGLNCKANAGADTILFISIIFIMALAAPIGYFAFNEINTELQSDPDATLEAKDTVQTLYSSYPSFMDGTIVFVFVLLWIFVIVASFMIDSHPIFFVISLLLIVFLVYISAELANGYEEIMQDETLGAFNVFPMTKWIIGHLPIVALIVGASILVVLFGKNMVR